MKGLSAGTRDNAEVQSLCRSIAGLSVKTEEHPAPAVLDRVTAAVYNVEDLAGLSVTHREESRSISAGDATGRSSRRRTGKHSEVRFPQLEGDVDSKRKTETGVRNVNMSRILSSRKKSGRVSAYRALPEERASDVSSQSEAQISETIVQPKETVEKEEEVKKEPEVVPERIVTLEYDTERIAESVQKKVVADVIQNVGEYSEGDAPAESSDKSSPVIPVPTPPPEEKKASQPHPAPLPKHATSRPTSEKIALETELTGSSGAVPGELPRKVSVGKPEHIRISFSRPHEGLEQVEEEKKPAPAMLRRTMTSRTERDSPADPLQDEAGMQRIVRRRTQQLLPRETKSLNTSVEGELSKKPDAGRRPARRAMHKREERKGEGK